MIIDLVHNKIVADTITSGFERSFEKNLVPALCERYGDREISVLQMYEDYISDNLMKDGYWYYPLTVVTSDGYSTEWIRWAVNEKNFEGGVPYSYIGSGEIAFELVDALEGFEDKLSGRARYCEDGLIRLRVESTAPDVIKLSGKYSQTFVDELARQITVAIGNAMSVTGLADSNLEFALIFAPGTFMEHTSENVTYRRLILADKVSAPRDFWIKWTRLDGAVAHSVAAHVTADNILFELGEDVSQKIREKEYRYLMKSGMDKYQSAMSRKNVTEWRDVIKRAIRRGELEKLETEIELSPETKALEEKLADVLVRAGVAASEKPAEVDSAPACDSDEFERAMQKMREITLGNASDEEPVAETIPVSEDVGESDEIVFDGEDSDDFAVPAEQGQVELFDEEEEEETDEEELDELDEFYAEDVKLEISEGAVPANDTEAEELEEITRLAMESLKEVNASKEKEDELDEIFDEDALEEEDNAETLVEMRALEPDEETVAEETEADETVEIPVVSAEREEDIRAELEAKIRLEYESRARRMAEEETARLRREQEAQRIENERKLAEARREQERLRLEYEKLREETLRIAAEREALDAVRRAEEEKLRSQIEAQLRQEARERERLAEAARLAVEEQRRLEEENARAERARLEEARRAEEERLRKQEEERIAAERAAEAERIRRDQEARRAAAATAMPTVGDGKYTYTTKTVKFIFRRSVDPNITTRIHEIIKATIDYYGKDKLFMRIRASIPDNQTVCLEFLQIPAEEMELLSNIIKILGNSGLGIAKAIVE